MSFHNLSKRSCSGGIRTLELLVGAAAAVILISMVPHLFGSMREEANRAMCASNLRDIGMAILAHDSEHGVLPGPTTRRIESPLRGDDRSGATVPREDWSSVNVCMTLLLEDYLGPSGPGDPGPFYCRSNAEAREFDLPMAYLLMRNIGTNPPSYFGDVAFDRSPIGSHEIIAAGTDPIGSEARRLSEIWMVSDIDAENYRVTGTGGGPAFDVSPPHFGGRNYVFFDGSLDFRTPDNWPANSGDADND